MKRDRAKATAKGRCSIQDSATLLGLDSFMVLSLILRRTAIIGMLGTVSTRAGVSESRYDLSGDLKAAGLAGSDLIRFQVFKNKRCKLSALKFGSDKYYHEILRRPDVNPLAAALNGFRTFQDNRPLVTSWF